MAETGPDITSEKTWLELFGIKKPKLWESKVEEPEVVRTKEKWVPRNLSESELARIEKVQRLLGMSGGIDYRTVTDTVVDDTHHVSVGKERGLKEKLTDLILSADTIMSDPVLNNKAKLEISESLKPVLLNLEYQQSSRRPFDPDDLTQMFRIFSNIEILRLEKQLEYLKQDKQLDTDGTIWKLKYNRLEKKGEDIKKLETKLKTARETQEQIIEIIPEVLKE